ncbi:alpha-hydroxy acid oxidase [Kordiimonas sp. SCSIO 12610]|uniref:alpha-hydroxy acid oxidase n=1 Tax=Kordiimonas sp. SCSIO 12610 TaxID=2829597 RepID=UPI00210BA8FF|nr:alpha-hydroxy acid oxidase [Kordiimonas sp. SCSIO 12610]UTW54680.1 alpha-hydroxy-acid oxidizing protein [Kordiimonas sp. SCSIO 12610]
MKLANCHNIADLRKAAKSRLPAPMFHYIDGGSDDEWTLKNNTRAFDKYELTPKVLKNVETIDLKTKILGTEIDLPFFLSPTGMSRLFNHEKEIAVAKAAEKFGTAYSLSTLGTTSLEDIAETVKTPKIFQLYILKDRGLTKEFVDRCKAAGYTALALTVDMPVAGNRERDYRTGMVMPPKFGLKSLTSFAMHPHWSLNFMLNPNFTLANVAHRVDALGGGAMGLIDYVNSQFDRTVNWDDAEWLIKQWDGPFIIKGLQHPEDAKRARDIGATALMISNHGGRQMDGAPAPIDCVKAIRDAIDRDLELIVDGGIRRGSHVLKAIREGADACSVGRAYLYGLAAGGQKGVERALTLLKSEIERNMALMGANRINDLI